MIGTESISMSALDTSCLGTPFTGDPSSDIVRTEEFPEIEWSEPEFTLSSDDDDTIRSVVDALVDDWARCNGRMPMETVERLCAKRGLEAPDRILVMRRLSEVGIEPVVSASRTTRRKETTDPLLKRASLFDHRVLSADQEVELGRRIAFARETREGLTNGTLAACTEIDRILRLGDEARETLVTHNLRLVMTGVRSWARTAHVPEEDSFQDGVIGLCKAADRFNHRLGCKFSTYAVWWIKQSIRRNAEDNWSLVRLPNYLVHVIRKIRAAFAELEKSLGRVPVQREIAEKTGVPPEKIASFAPYLNEILVSLDEPFEKGGEVRHRLFSKTLSPQEILLARERRERVEEMFSCLSRREKEIVELRFGFIDDREWTLEEIGRRYGLTRERIRQIESKAMDKLTRRSRTRAYMDLNF